MDGLDTPDFGDTVSEGGIPIHSADGSHGCHEGGGACTCQYPHGLSIQGITTGIPIMEILGGGRNARI